MEHIPETGPLGLDKDQPEASVIPPPLPSQFSLEICNLASDAIIILDHDQRISYFNLSAAEMFGYLQEEALGQPLDLLIPQRYHAAHQQHLRNFRKSPDLSRRMSQRKPIIGLRKDGSEFPLEIAISKFSHHEDTFFTAIARDITERVQAEETIQNQEQLYHSIITAMDEGIMLQGVNGKILTCNTSAERILGSSQDQIQGRNSADPRWRAIHEDGSPFSGETHPAMITLCTGNPQSNVIMGKYKPDGTLVWITMNSQPLFRKEDRRPYAMATSFSDITDRKLSEQILLESEERYRSLFDNSMDAILLTAPDGRLLAANVAACQLFDRTDEEIRQPGFDYSVTAYIRAPP